MIRWPVANILGWIGLPALRLRPATTLPSFTAPASALTSDRLLFVLDSELSLEFIVSSRLCTPKALSPISLAIGVFCMLSSCDESRSRDVFLPRCVLRSISFSLRRKKVVGPEWPRFAKGDDCAAPALFAFNVRFLVSSDALIVQLGCLQLVFTRCLSAGQLECRARLQLTASMPVSALAEVLAPIAPSFAVAYVLRWSLER